MTGTLSTLVNWPDSAYQLILTYETDEAGFRTKRSIVRLLYRHTLRPKTILA